MVNFVVIKIIDLSFVLYKLFNRFFAISSDWLSHLFFFAYFVLLFFRDLKDFEFTNYFVNFVNPLFYLFLFYVQFTYARQVKNLKSSKNKELSQIHYLDGPWRFWHEVIIFINVLFMFVLLIGAPLAFFVNICGAMWHAFSLYYVDIGGKSLYSKVKEKVKNLVQSKTPVYSPSGI